MKTHAPIDIAVAVIAALCFGIGLAGYAMRIMW
jgi:hypothetical protein